MIVECDLRYFIDKEEEEELDRYDRFIYPLLP